MIGLFRGSQLRRLCAFALPLVLLLSFSTTGCANSCFVAVSNPGGTVIGGTVSNLPLACAPSVKKTTIKVLANVTTLCEACSTSNRVQEVFLSVRGIELRAKASASDDSSEWLELFPDLEKRSLQVDLMSGDTDATASSLLGESAAIPAGIYDQARLRLVPNQGDMEGFSAGNACGESGFNCMTMADGRGVALQVDNEAQELRIASEASAGGLLFISPDENEALLIQFAPIWSMVSSFPEGPRLLPVLKGNVRIERVADPNRPSL